MIQYPREPIIHLIPNSIQILSYLRDRLPMH